MKNKRALFTLDLEDHLGRYDETSRYVDVTRMLMRALAENDIRGTVFVVAKIANSAPELLREIAELGHEIGCHSLAHIPLDKQDPQTLRNDTYRAKHELEDCIGKEVVGFRAPVFSLVKDTRWFVDDLQRMGFRYSSSVMPTHSPLYGFPGAPDTPFKWSNGLVELPCPIGKFGPVALPYLGGFYLRYLPSFLTDKMLKRAPDDACLWTYCHPYDFDQHEPFSKISGAATWVSILLWFNRKNTMKKIFNIVPGSSRITLASWVEENEATLPTFA